MKRTIEQKRSFLRWHNQRGIADVRSHGYIWFRNIYCAYISDLEKTGQKKDYPLLADSYYMVGDVHDFNDGPKAAIKAYRKSFALDSRCTGALREIGNMYSNIGDYKKALYFLKKSLRLEPRDEYTKMDYEITLDESKYKSRALYEKNDICWQAREMLAQDKPEIALRLLKHKRTILAYQIIANAYAMLDYLEGVLEQWRIITKSRGMIEMRFADWFYIEDCVWDSLEFWELLAYCARQKRFDYSIWPMFKSLDKVIPHPLKRRRSNADRSRCLQRVYLLTQYHVARLSHDYSFANKLAQRFPKWPEIQKLAAGMKQ